MIGSFCDGCWVVISGVVCLLEICVMGRVWGLCHFFCFAASPRCHVGVLPEYRVYRNQQAKPGGACVSNAWVYLCSLSAYQPRGRRMWASYLIPLLCLSLPHLHGGRYLLFIFLNGHGVSALSLELTSWNGVSCLRPWSSLWFHYLFQSPDGFPSSIFHKAKHLFSSTRLD